MNENVDFEELSVMILGGVYYKKLPGRGIAIRKEYRPIFEIIVEAFVNLTKAIYETGESMDAFWLAGVKALADKHSMFLEGK